MADLTTQLADQLDWHWRGQLRPRLDGLTDDEYFWQPVPDCWTDPPGRIGGLRIPSRPSPAPFTTVAWRMAHVIVGRVRDAQPPATSADRPPATRAWDYATDAATALRQLDQTYAAWNTGVRSLSADDLNRDAAARPRGRTPSTHYPS